MSEQFKVWFEHDPEKLQAKGFTKEIAEWEDGMRTDGKKGSYEWWYMDGKFEDGTTISVVFFTKLSVAINQDLNPIIEVTLSKLDGTTRTISRHYKPEDFQSSGETCNVNIAGNTWIGNLKDYTISFSDKEENIELKIKMKSISESWRCAGSGDGLANFGDTGRYIGWLIAVPQGTIEAEITENGKTEIKKGTCYHDHNWGNYPMQDMFNHWYWCRTEIGPYAIISAHLCLTKEYNLTEYDEIMLAKNGKIIMQNPECQKLWRSTPHPQNLTGKLVSDEIRYEYIEDGNGFQLTLSKKSNIRDKFMIPDEKAREEASKLGYNMGYHRLTGKAELKMIENGQFTKTYTNDAAVWEMMSFHDPE